MTDKTELQNVIDLATREPLISKKDMLFSGGGGGTFDGMNERVAKLEARSDIVERQLDRIATKLDSMDEKLSRLPTKDFLIAVIAIVVAAGLAVAALTFNIADYASKNAQQAEQAKQAATTAPPPQPIIITVPTAGSTNTSPSPVPPTSQPVAPNPQVSPPAPKQ